MTGYEPQSGDIAACWGADWVSRRISIFTSWPWAPHGLKIGPSHVAIIAPGPFDQLLWYESTTKSPRPCLFHGENRDGVQVHYIDDRAGDYLNNGGQVVIYRPVEPFSPRESLDTWADLASYLAGNVPYDIVGAVTSGLPLTSRILSRFVAPRDDLFCSDMVAGLLMLRRRMPLDDPDRWTPAALLRWLVQNRQYRKAVAL